MRSFFLPGIFLTVCLQGAAVADTEGAVSESAEVARAAVPSRANSNRRPMYLIHGWAKNSSHNCASYWGDALRELPRNGWSGPLITWGYYQGDSNCTYKFSGSQATRVKEIGLQLAWEIYNRYSRHNISVDVMAHSMGGLVTRAALTGVAKREQGFPTYLLIEDVITLSTPHTGTNWARLCTTHQCEDMRPGSGLLRWLQQSPQSSQGTDWTLIGADDDDTITSGSATGMNAGHKIIYYSGQGIEHGAITQKVSGSFRLKYWNYYTSGWHEQRSGVAPVLAGKNALYWWSRW